MKKIIIVNNNMKVGGVQKSLYNLLWAIQGQYDVTLCLFSAAGAYLDKLPPGVKVMECAGLFRYLGMSQGECRRLDHRLKRGCLAGLSRLFGRPAALKILLGSQKTLPETYDCAIAFLHNGSIGNFYGGVQEFVLRRIRARRKIAFLHCDYRSCGANHPQNNRIIAEFDRIAACSDGCRRAFGEVLPELLERSVTVRNCHRFDEIRAMAAQERVEYDPHRVNVVTVCRLAHEKGVERAIEAVAAAAEKGLAVTLHIVGSGAMERELRESVRGRGLEESVRFYGERENPYPFMAGADLFVLTSYHEAAPMVIEEARCLGLPVLTTRTTSSDEMVLEANCGWVCENDHKAITESLLALVENKDRLRRMKQSLQAGAMDNSAALEQFAALTEG